MFAGGLGRCFLVGGPVIRDCFGGVPSPCWELLGDGGSSFLFLDCLGF